MSTLRIAHVAMVVLVWVVIFTAAIGCSSSVTDTSAATNETIQVEEEYKLTQQFDLSISISSTKFNETRRIPRQYSCTQEDISPPISWEGIPVGTVSFALIVDSNQHAGPPWVHWVLWNIPSTVMELPEAVPKTASVPLVGMRAGQGTNTEKNIGWTGPCPPPVLVGNKSQVSSAKTYRFKLYALDTEVELESSATKNNLLRNIDGHILAGGELTGEHVSQKQCTSKQAGTSCAKGPYKGK